MSASSDADRKLLDIFMEAQAKPEGRTFSENVLAGIKAVIAAQSGPSGEAITAAEVIRWAGEKLQASHQTDSELALAEAIRKVANGSPEAGAER